MLRYRAIFQSAVDFAILALNREGRITDWNHGAERIFGWRAEEMHDAPAARIFTPEDVAEGRPETEMSQALAAGRASDERWHLRKDGSRFWANGEMHPLIGEDGAHLGFLKILRDRTQRTQERARAQAALAESEALKRAILEAALDCIITIDPDGNVVEWNPAAVRTFGFARDDALGRPVADLIIPPAQREAHRLGLSRYFATGEGRLVGRRVEVEALRADGTRFAAEIAITPLSIDGRTLFTAYLRDITDRNRAAAALRESEARLRDLLATLDLGAFMVRDLDGTIQFWSQGCEQLYGWSAEEAVGRHVDDLLQTVFPSPAEEISSILLRDGDWSGDLIQRRRDGAKITVAARKALRRDAAGQPVALAVSVADVTALRATRAELQQLNESLEARVHEEVAARQTAQSRLAQAEKLNALGQLAGGIAHDFNNILQATQGGAALIRRHARDEAAVNRLAQMIEDAARRGASVTRRLLAFARKGELRAEPIDMPRLLNGIYEVLAHALGAMITIRLEVAPGLPMVLADRGQLETVLVNLATNARDAMPNGGSLTFSASIEAIREGVAGDLMPGSYVRLVVTDTGTGMDAATLARAPEPFFTTKPQGQGTGLGLAMARGFAEQSGGALTIASQRGRGTSVALWLPAADAGAAGRADASGEEPTAAADSKLPRVLLVDDEDLVRDVLAEQLLDFGYDVVQASGGAAALALLDEGEMVDALISDFSMPGMNGVALIRAALDRRPHLPAILLTGYAGDAGALAATEAIAGSFTLMRKPIGGAELADRLAGVLDARTPGQIDHPAC